jgi:hypothetical protein
VRATGTMFGHTMVQFPLGLGLAALDFTRSVVSAQRSHGLRLKCPNPDQIVVIGAGHWRGEGMALVEAIKIVALDRLGTHGATRDKLAGRSRSPPRWRVDIARLRQG